MSPCKCAQHFEASPIGSSLIVRLSNCFSLVGTVEGVGWWRPPDNSHCIGD